MSAIVVLCVLILLSSTAGAQAVYKCTGDAKISYGDRPCADGPSLQLKIPPAPVHSAADQATLARQNRELARMDKERRRTEEKELRERERHARAAAVLHKKCAAMKLNSKWAAEDARGASGKQAARAALKARRAAEKLALECPA
ncbi:MAG TPA: DUF4124 domain-containing protein [Janthinobacterium sp.]|jgi:hypothetical protein|nr:DUF4124 domain-containing protein [Janthinobacterium sp.]